MQTFTTDIKRIHYMIVTSHSHRCVCVCVCVCVYVMFYDMTRNCYNGYT